MKRKTVFPIFLAAILALAGCSRVSQEADKAAKEAENAITEPAESISFTDDAGRTITLDKQPDRVAALIGSFADIWCSAGGSDTLVAAAGDTWTSFDLDLPDTVLDLGSVKSPNTEVLLAAEPDFVLASLKTEADKELEPVLEDQGIPVAYFEVSDFDDYLRMLDICTQLTGDDEAYQTCGLDQQAQIDADIRLAETKPARTVLYLRASSKSVKAKGSKGTVLGEMLASLHTVNVADSQESLLENLSMEGIMAADPEEIFIVYQGKSGDDTAARAQMKSWLSDPAWQSLKAVQEDRVHVMDPSLYNLKPNARWAQAYDELTELLYGEPAAKKD
ncbi:ABC transporter substrate-binding protein [Faecalibaculum rodentium]|uniref:ABC transporter substrate-binding protein n=1 Tax=Faecalibaculum rodentium TaxID=1702221 RepID=UPI0023F5597B|nr:ABC transporter substrate-binding protein [Faecalibaculum rodentium]